MKGQAQSCSEQHKVAAWPVLIGAMPLWIVAPLPVWGEDTSANAGGIVEEIVVTAQRKGERLSETALAVSALSSTDLERLNVTQFTDFATYVPGVSFASSGAGQTQVNLRGVTTGVATGPTVGIYVDDVPYGGSSVYSYSAQTALDVGIFGLDRIEVLRGPQGTLYGASSLGGVIKYVTREPDRSNSEFEVGADISYMSAGDVGYSARASGNFPIVADKAGLRLGVFDVRDGGFIDNVAGGRNVNQADIYGGRIDLSLAPTDAMTVRLSVFGQNIERDARSAVDKDRITGNPLYGSLEQNRLVSEPFDQEFRLASADVTYDFGAATLKSITGYQTVSSDAVQDVTGLYGPLLAGFGIVYPKYAFTREVETDKFTQELRLASAAGAPLEWLIGAFYTYEDNTNDQALLALDSNNNPAPINLLTGGLPSDSREIAGFADITYYFTPRFDVMIGARMANNKQHFQQVGSGLFIGSLPKAESEETVTTYLFNPRFRINEDLMVYSRAASGYRPGGPNAVLNDPATGVPMANPTFNADTLWSYEGGIKASTADKRYSIDAAVYFIDWKNLQVVTVRNGFSVIANGGAAESKGVELTLTAQPLDGLHLTGVLAYSDAKLSEDSPDLGGAKGEHLPDVPKFTGAITADYTFPLGQDVIGSIGGSLRYVDDRTSSFDESIGIPQYHLRDYFTTDLRAGLEFGRISAQLYARNIADERGELSAFTGFSTAGGPAQITVLQPRTIGLNLSARF